MLGEEKKLGVNIRNHGKNDSILIKQIIKKCSNTKAKCGKQRAKKEIKNLLYFTMP